MYQSIENLRNGSEYRLTAVEIIRQALRDAEAKHGQPEQPKLFTNEECAMFKDNDKHIGHFLASEDGRDLIVLLCSSFYEFCEAQEEKVHAESANSDKEHS